MFKLVLGFAAQGFFLFFRGEEFREDFKDLSVLKAFFPNVPTMGLKATAPPHLLGDLKQILGLKNDCNLKLLHETLTELTYTWTRKCV